jgi:hypothetical protein
MLTALKIYIERERKREGSLLNEYCLEHHYILPEIDDSIDECSLIGKM